MTDHYPYRALQILFLLAANLSGLTRSHAQTRVATPNPAQSTLVPLEASVKLVPYRDPWLPARERWRDIADNPLRAFQSGSQAFNYGGSSATERQPQVTLSYSTAPPVPYFIGRIDATGLKPNFAYQLKLVGKPTKGSQGWGAQGDEFTNESLGYAGRWWCGHPIHASGTNFDDAHYLNEYKNALPGMEHNIYGYIYMGEFITDGSGDAHVNFWGDHPYHISWASWQGGVKDVLAWRWPVRSAPTSNANTQYGYGSSPFSTSVTLYYENEPGRTQPLTLPPGNYRCRFLITEESFHNPVAATPEGGYWKTVLASEDLIYDDKGNIIGHDTDAANDVAFSIGSDPSITAMTAKVMLTATQVSPQTYQAMAQVVVTDSIGRPIRGAAVKGHWSGIYNEREVSGNTNRTGMGGMTANSDGVAQFSTPAVKAKRGQCFRFIITDVAKTGRTWNQNQHPGAQLCP